MNRQLVCFAAIGAIAGSATFGAMAQGCGKPSGKIVASEHFIMAQYRMMSESDSMKASGNYLFGAITVDLNLDHLRTESNSLSIDQARAYLQEAYATQNENILAECGYRMCLLERNQKALDSVGTTLYAEVCRASLGGGAIPKQTTGLKAKPAMIGAMFINTASAPLTREIQLFNDGDGALSLRVVVEGGVSGAPLVKIVGGKTEFNLPRHSSKRIAIRIANPKLRDEIIRGTVRFQIVSNPDAVASVAYTILSGLGSLVPPPKIGLGSVSADAAADWDTDHTDLNPFRDTKPGTYPVPVGRIAAEGSFKYGDHGVGAFSATADAPPPSPSHASVTAKIVTQYGGKCGQGSSGGGGRVTPRWTTNLSLPQTAKHEVWSVKVLSFSTASSVGNPLTGDLVPGGGKTCQVRIGTWTDVLAVPGNDDHAAVELPPGEYSLDIICPQMYAGCRGKAGGIIESYVNFNFDFTVDATRVAAPPKAVKAVTKAK